jgi:hypothetical protein
MSTAFGLGRTIGLPLGFCGPASHLPFLLRASVRRHRTSQKYWLDFLTIGWCEGDREPFAVINAAPRAMEFLPKVLNRPESDAPAARIEVHFELHGFGLWAVEVPGVASFVGFVGLSVPSFEAHFAPCVKVGCRLGFDPWGRGYATEAARGAPVRLRGACTPGDRLVHGGRTEAVTGRDGADRDDPRPGRRPPPPRAPEGHLSGASLAEPGSKERVTWLVCSAPFPVGSFAGWG